MGCNAIFISNVYPKEIGLVNATCHFAQSLVEFLSPLFFSNLYSFFVNDTLPINPIVTFWIFCLAGVMSLDNVWKIDPCVSFTPSKDEERKSLLESERNIAG